MPELTQKKCEPCEGGVEPLKGDRINDLKKEIDSDWEVVDEHHLEREIEFDDFKQALAYTNQIGAIAEDEGHHPDIYLTYGKVGLKIWTHSIDGLSENDFILAAKADRALTS